MEPFDFDLVLKENRVSGMHIKSTVLKLITWNVHFATVPKQHCDMRI